MNSIVDIWNIIIKYDQMIILHMKAKIKIDWIDNKPTGVPLLK